MVMARLSTESKPLVQEISALSGEDLRRFTRTLVELALRDTAISDPRLDAALQALRSSLWGDTSIRQDLRDLVQELDTIAWDAQDALEQVSGGAEHYSTAFALARTASALDFALDVDPLEAALEAAHEVRAAHRDVSSIRTVLRSM